MKILVTGICGFAGSSLALELRKHFDGIELLGLDNLSRPGSEVNRGVMRQHGIRFLHGDVRNPSDLECLPRVDWVIDASANPSVLAGVQGETSSRQLVEHNLQGTLHLLEFCKRNRAGFLLLSTSRVYSAGVLSALPLDVRENAFVPRLSEPTAPGVSELGISEAFSTQTPVSLYGAAKLASEVIALEYAYAFDLPVHINRCGVLAGAGQFGKPDQGIFSFWIHSYRQKRPLKYIGFGGHGYQTRDCLHPRDLAFLVASQLRRPGKNPMPMNVSGGMRSAISLRQLSDWCASRFGPHPVGADVIDRPYDVPWLVLDSSRAVREWNWKPTIPLEQVLAEIATHAEKHPDWLELSSDA